MTKKPSKGCAICGKPRVAAFDPFCSERCKAVDLNRWLSGSYVVPGLPVEEDEDDARVKTPSPQPSPAGGRGGRSLLPPRGRRWREAPDEGES